MNKKYYHCTKKIGLLILAAVILATIVETFIFNFSYFTLAKDEKGTSLLDLDTLVLHDLEIKENQLKVIGDKPYFEINNKDNILRLKILLKPDCHDFNIQQEGGNEYSTNIELKNYLVMKANLDSKKFNLILGKDVEGLLIDKIYIDNGFDFNMIRFLFILSIIIVIEYFIFFIEVAKKKLHITFFILMVTLGNVIAISTPMYFPYDEKAHFIRSYETSRGDFELRESRDIRWIDNIEEFFRDISFKSPFDNHREREELQNKFRDREYTVVKRYESTAETYPFIPYLPSSIGLFLGRKLGASFLNMFFLGRIFSVLAYATIGMYIIRKIKAAKKIVFTLLILPGNVFLAASYSADPMTFIFSLATVGIFINMLASNDDSVNFKYILGFLGCVTIAIMGKITYAPLVLLLLAVPKRKFRKRIANSDSMLVKLKILCLVIIGILTVGVYIISSSKGINQWHLPGVDVHKQEAFILHNIFKYCGVVASYFSESAIVCFESPSILLGHVNQLNSAWLILAMGILFFVSIVDNESNIFKLRIIDKIVILITVIGGCGLVITALYVSFTPVGDSHVAGVQGRYFEPLMLPFLLLFKNNRIQHNFNKEKLNYFLSIILIMPLLATAFKIFSGFNM